MQDAGIAKNEYRVNALNRELVRSIHRDIAARKEKYAPPFDEKEVEFIDRCFAESDEPCVSAFYLCLYAGLSPLEAAVLPFGNLDFAKKEIRVDASAATVDTKIVLTAIPVRIVPMLDCVYSFLLERGADTRSPENYVFTNTEFCADSIRTVETSFRRIIKTRLAPDGVYSASLRSTFVKRCIEANMNMESVSSLTGMSLRELHRDFSEYIHADNSVIRRLEQKEAPIERKMNLLILGAGSHGHDIREAAKALGVFQKVSFLDDSVIADDVIGKCRDYMKFTAEYPVAFVAFGNNELRREWTLALKKAGYIIPRLIHPHATISADAQIGEGTVVLAQATVNSMAQVGESCIIAQNSMIGFQATVGAYAHVDCGGIVMKNAHVPEMAVVRSAEVVYGSDNE